MKIFYLSLAVLAQLVLSDMVFAEDQAPAVNFDPVQILFAEALTAKQSGDLLTARGNLEDIMAEYPDAPQAEEVLHEWRDVMWQVIHSAVPAPEAIVHEVGLNDTLGKIARHYGTTIELIKVRNKLNSNVIKFGQKLSVWNTPFTLDINKTTNHLSLDLNGKAIKIYPVSTGKSETTTPVGQFVIKDRYPNPTWFHHGDIVPPNVPNNFLGTRWLGFDRPKYGIHGTIYPELIGQSVSGGCVRMKNADVEELYDIVPVDTHVEIFEHG